MTDEEQNALEAFTRLVAFAYKVRAYVNRYENTCNCPDCDVFGEMRPDNVLPPLLEQYADDLESLGEMARDIMLDACSGDLGEMSDEKYFKVYEVITT